MEPTLGTALDAARARMFVGRRAERELLAAALDTDAPGWSVLWVHGPGGVGKSTLLERLAADASNAGARVATVSADSLTVDGPRSIRVDLGRNDGRALLLVDDAEQLGSAQTVLREDILPRLPAGVLVVVAGRDPPDHRWRGDPAWRERLRIVSLRNLTTDDSDLYLDRCGIDQALRPALIAASHGHPLALSLLADLCARGQTDGAVLASGVAAAPDVVQSLLGQIVDDVPTPVHRDALQVAAVARVTTESLIRDALSLDGRLADEVFAWLRDRPYIHVDAEGVAPHDLVRDVLDADLRWRDPAAYAEVFRRVRRHIHQRLESLRGAEQRRAIADEKYVFRNLPSILSPVDWSSWGSTDPRPAVAGDRAVVLDLVEAAEGAESAAIAARWWDLQPEGFFVLSDPTHVVSGFMALLTLSDLDRSDLSFDPVASAAVALVEREAPVRSGEVVTQTRFVIDRDRYQDPSPTLNSVPILTLQRYLQTPNLAWDLLVLFEPDAMDEYFAIADLPRVHDADATVGGRRYGQFAHDFRRVPVREWLDGVTDRALAQDPSPPSGSPDALIVLSHDAFTDAVRQALRDLNRPDRLAQNPLARSRVVRDVAGQGRGGEAVSHVVREAVELLEVDPKDERRHRAVARTYLARSPSQERVAETLGLPFSTYRRHLTEGVDAVVDHLWQRELHGPSSGQAR